MNKEERQNRILQLIEQADQNRLLGTQSLAEDLDVSAITIRRDLQELSQRGLLHRQHGGAGQLNQQPKPSKKEIGILLVSRTRKYSDPFFNSVLEGVEQRLHELNCDIAYISTHAEINTAVQMEHLLNSKAVDGLVLVGPPLGSEPIQYLKTHMRALVSIAGQSGINIETITFDGYYGIRQMIDHLVKCGYRRLAFITGHNDARQRGYIDGLAANGLPNDPALCISLQGGIDGWIPQIGQIGAQKLVELTEPPDVILCASDMIAIGAIQWLHEHNIRVPEDIGVTGFDDIAQAAFTVPSLTTVHVHKQLIGRLAAERLVQRIDNPDELPLFIQTPTELVIRRSCRSE